MVKINLGGSVEEAFEKIALEKGWVVNAAPNSETVKQLQTELNKLAEVLPIGGSPFPLDVDGIVGSKTRRALHRAQSFVGKFYQRDIPDTERHTAKHRDLTVGLSELGRGDVDGMVQGLRFLNRYFSTPHLQEQAEKPAAPTTEKPMDWYKGLSQEEQRQARELFQRLKASRTPQSDEELLARVQRFMKGAAAKNKLEKVAANPMEWFRGLAGPQQSAARRKVELFMGQGLSRDDALRRTMNLMAPPSATKPSLTDLIDPWAEEERPQSEDIMKDVEEKMKEQYPGFHFTASVVQNLVKLANDLDEMGEEKAAAFVDDQLKVYSAEVNKLYDITGETGEDLINQAHPGGGTTIAEAKEEGGKVETIVEQQKKDIEKALKAPTGKYAKLNAEMIKKLVSLANDLEARGEMEMVKEIDNTLKTLTS